MKRKADDLTLFQRQLPTSWWKGKRGGTFAERLKQETKPLNRHILITELKLSHDYT